MTKTTTRRRKPTSYPPYKMERYGNMSYKKRKKK